jgi:hypothetical protein
MSKKQLAFFWAVLLFVVFGSIVALKIAQGYRADIQNRTITHTGLLVATSIPDGAQLWADGKFRTATNTTLNLNPGTYEVEIKKEGFFPWKKQILIEKGLVKKTDTYLFSSSPDLKAITFLGVINPTISPDGQKIVFGVRTAEDTAKNGLWSLDLTDNTFGLISREPYQIVKNTILKDYTTGKIEWSPDSKEILLKFVKITPKTKTKPETENIVEAYVLAVGRLNLPTEIKDITKNIIAQKSLWDDEKATRNKTQLSKLPESLLKIVSTNADNIIFSPDETKFMYAATASATIPDKIIPSSLPARSNQPETRNIEPGKIYVFDLKEDRNFYITDLDPNKKIAWLGTSKHLMLVEKGKVRVGEYDNTNWNDVYTGPFEDLYAFPYPSANKIIVLTSIGKDTPPNLYAVILR